MKKNFSMTFFDYNIICRAMGAYRRSIQDDAEKIKLFEVADHALREIYEELMRYEDKFSKDSIMDKVIDKYGDHKILSDDEMGDLSEFIFQLFNFRL